MTARRSRPSLVALVAALALALAAPVASPLAATTAGDPTVPTPGEPFVVTLPSLGHDLVVDAGRNVLWVSTPGDNTVAAVSLLTYEVLDRVFVGDAPRGVALSPDGASLAVALETSGSVAFLDIGSGDVAAVDVTDLLGGPRAWDVSWPVQDAVFVASRNQGGKCVRLDLAAGPPAAGGAAAGPPAAVVADGDSIHDMPRFEEDAAGQFLYVNHSSQLYKLDVTLPTAPIAGEAFLFSSSRDKDLHPDGTRLVVRSGDVLDTDTFDELGFLGGGVPLVRPDGAQVWIPSTPARLRVFDLDSYAEVGELPMPASTLGVIRLANLPEGGVVALREDEVFGYGAPAGGGVTISPPSGRLVAGREIDVAFVVDGAGRELASFTAMAGGADITERIEREAVQGVVGEGSGAGGGASAGAGGGVVSFRLEDVSWSATPELELVFRATFDDGSLLVGRAEYRVDAVDPDGQVDPGPGSAPVALPPEGFRQLQLPGAVTDVLPDLERGVAFLAMHLAGQVAVVSLAQWEVVGFLDPGGSPRSLALSPDGGTLYMALSQSGSVAAYDFATASFEILDLLDELGTVRTWDVSAPRADEVFVSANGASSAVATRILRVDRAAGDAVSVVASNTIIDRSPIFEEDPRGDFLFVGESGSPYSIYKLDLRLEDAPLVLEDDHGSVNGLGVMHPDGARLLSPSRVLRSGSLIELAPLPFGLSAVSANGATALVLGSGGVVRFVDLETYEETGSEVLPFSASTTGEFVVLPGEARLVVHGGAATLQGAFSLAGARISPPAGTYLATQELDLTLRVHTGGARVAQLTVLADGVDITERVRAEAVEGALSTGELTFTLEDMTLAAPELRLELSVLLDDGRLLETEAVYEVLDVFE